MQQQQLPQQLEHKLRLRHKQEQTQPELERKQKKTSNLSLRQERGKQRLQRSAGKLRKLLRHESKHCTVDTLPGWLYRNRWRRSVQRLRLGVLWMRRCMVRRRRQRWRRRVRLRRARFRRTSVGDVGVGGRRRRLVVGNRRG